MSWRCLKMRALIFCMQKNRKILCGLNVEYFGWKVFQLFFNFLFLIWYYFRFGCSCLFLFDIFCKCTAHALSECRPTRSKSINQICLLSTYTMLKLYIFLLWICILYLNNDFLIRHFETSFCLNACSRFPVAD